ncbi:uncharacterized transporter YBR043C [Kluyveromyces marxianus]|nr:uncharacterized transporter YBR043C [Kluyveromyces marxianus]
MDGASSLNGPESLRSLRSGTKSISSDGVSPHVPCVLHHDELSGDISSAAVSEEGQEPGQERGERVERVETLGKMLTNISTTFRDKSKIVPRSERRGLFANLALVPEYTDAREYPLGLKMFIVVVIAYSAIMGPMGTSIVFPAIGPLVADFNTSTIMVDVSVGIYLLSLGIFPIWWSSLSELKGRRTVYVISFSLMVGFTIGSALSPNISAFIVFRMLQGASSASVQSVGAGTISDLFIPEERGKNLGYYYLGTLMAPLLSPIIGALLVNRWSWRSTQWFMVILAGVNVLLVTLLLPETLRKQDNSAAIAMILAERRMKQTNGTVTEEPQAAAAATTTTTENDSGPAANDEKEKEKEKQQFATELQRYKSHTSTIATIPNKNEDVYDTHLPQLSKIRTHDARLEEENYQNDLRRAQTQLMEEIEKIESSKHPKTELWKEEMYIYFIKPLKSLHFLKYPPVTLAIIFSAISFAILYVVNMTIEYCYSRPPYNFKPLYIGLLYIPNSVTYIIASIYGGRWVDNLLIRYKEKHGVIAPEARIGWNVVVAVVTFPIGLLIFGWCLDKHEHWVTPLIGTAIFGFASMMTIGATVSYLVDSLPGRGATGVALNNLIRMILAAVSVFITTPMLKGMGVGWTFTMLALIVVASSSVLVLLKRNGDYFREHYDLQDFYAKLE